MAIRTFNSVGGFSVGEIPVNIISNVGEITGPGNANISGTVYACTALRTNSLLHLDGTPWDFQQPAGAANGQLQYYSGGDFGASANLTFVDTVGATKALLSVTGNVSAGNITASGSITGSDFYGTFHGAISGDITAPGGSGSNTYIVFNDAGMMNAVSGFSFDKSDNSMTLTGNLSAGNTTQTNAKVTSLTAGRITVAGTGGTLVDSSALTFSSGNLSVTGNANISGNTSVANITVTSLTSGRIALVGTDGLLVDSSTLTFGSGNLGVTGNANISGYASIGGDATITGNASAANVTVTSLTSGRLVVASTGGKLSDSSGLTYSSSNLNITGNIVATGNISGVDETLSGNLSATGNISGNNASFGGNVSVTGNVSGNIASFTGNVSGTNASFTGNASVTGNVSGNNASFGGNVSITGNISGNNETLTGNLAVENITANGSITGADFYGSFHGSIVGDITAPGGSGANTYVVFNDVGKMNAVAGFSFDKSTNSLDVTGNLSAANISTGLVTGTLTVASNAQPNITSVGTLTSVAVSGNANVTNTVNTGNLNVTAKVISSLIPSSGTTYDLGSSLLPWNNAYVGTNLFVGGTSAYLGAVGNVLQTDALNAANNANVGSLTVRGNATLQTDLTVSGNLTVGGSTTYVNVTNTSIKDPLIDLGGSGNGADATSYDGKDRGLILHNYDSGAGAAVNQAFIWKTADSEFQAYGNVTEYADETVTGTYGNIRANVMFANLTGQVLTASQTNITSVGTLGNLVVAGNTTTANANITSTFKASGLTYPGSDGTNGQVLQTNGSGSLSFVTIDTWRIQNTTSNVSVVSSGNVMTYIGGNEKVRVSTSGVEITGNLIVSANTSLTQTTVTNLDVTSFYPNGVASSVVTSIKSATVTTSSIAQQKIASIDALTARGVEFFVKGEDIDGTKYTVATVSAVHNGGSVDYAIYGTVNLPSSDTTGNLLVTLSGGFLSLEVTPASSNTTVWTTQYRTI